MDRDFDPRGDDFDAYECWNANCDKVEEECFGNIDDEDYEEFLCCGAPADYECPLCRKIKKNKLTNI